MKGVQIGLRNLVIAVMTDDPAFGTGTASYQAPVALPGAISANVTTNASNATLFADDGPYDTAATIGEIGLELNVADLPLEIQSLLLGHAIEGGIMKRRSTDTPPWVAVGFKTLKSNSKYRYTWLNKGKFSVPDQNNGTKGDSVEFQTPTISGSFVKRDCDDEYERHIDEDHVDYVSSLGQNWFTGPYGGTPDTTPATIASTVPVNNATAVAVTSTVVWNFSEALALSTLTTDHFLVVKDSDGSAVAGSLTVNGARTQVTFTPTANLSATTAYRAVVTTGVRNLAGLPLASSTTIKFTTV